MCAVCASVVYTRSLNKLAWKDFDEGFNAFCFTLPAAVVLYICHPICQRQRRRRHSTCFLLLLSSLCIFFLSFEKKKDFVLPLFFMRVKKKLWIISWSFVFTWGFLFWVWMGHLEPFCSTFRVFYRCYAITGEKYWWAFSSRGGDYFIFHRQALQL